MGYYSYGNPDWVEEPSKVQERVLSRMDAISYTLACIHEEMFDPIDTESRADLLIAAEEIALGALALASRARNIAWGPQQLQESERE